VAAAIGGSARTVAVDRPGWDGRTGASDLAGNAAAALTALDRREIGQAVVVGHSFGGAVAAWLAATHPERVRALVLAAPSANRASLSTLDRVLAAPVFGDALGAAALAGASLALGLSPTRRELSRRFAVEQSYLRATSHALRTPRAWRSFVEEQRVLLRDLPALEALLRRITAPSTIVIGERDRVIPLASAELLARQIAGASLVTVPAAGHLLPLRHPGQIAEALKCRLSFE
jgi:4,5:9,10-diseco-3-hydroxy-5,9,17-trioxoandrosta-1(10),2-diene-4-oate hydrolase